MGLPDLRDELTEYSRMLLLYRGALRELSAILETLGEESQFSNRYNPIRLIETRIKPDESIVRKLQRKGKDVTVDNIRSYVEDVAGMKILCRNTTDIYRVVDLIGSLPDLNVLREKDYQRDPKMSGYRSYHMVVEVPVRFAGKTIPTKVELQIHTMAMDVWAELEYELSFRSRGQVSEQTLKELRECADMIQFMDKKMQNLREI